MNLTKFLATTELYLTMQQSEDFEERAAIYEYDAGMPRPQAEAKARMKGCSHCGKDQLREGFKWITFSNGRGGREICAACFERRRTRSPS